MLDKGIQINKYEIKKSLDIGRVDDYQKAQDIYNNHFKKRK